MAFKHQNVITFSQIQKDHIYLLIIKSIKLLIPF